MKAPNQKREDCDGYDRSQRNVAKQEYNSKKNANCDEYRFRSDHGKRSKSSRNSLAAAELKPYRKDMPQDREEGSKRHYDERKPLRSRDSATYKDGEPDRCRAFQRVEHQRHHSKCRRFARDIGCADITAPSQPYVLSTKDAYQ